MVTGSSYEIFPRCHCSVTSGADWVQLWSEMNDVTPQTPKPKVETEAFFLTHSADLHQIQIYSGLIRGRDYLGGRFNKLKLLQSR